MGRTFVIGDIHGALNALIDLLMKLPKLRTDDTLVTLGDYVDRGPDSRQVVGFVRNALPQAVKAKVITLKGNHEDGWVHVVDGTKPQFVLPMTNGCLATLRSWQGRAREQAPPPATGDETTGLLKGDFLPADVVEWMNGLPLWYEDEHAIYVHAGVPRDPETGRWQHPSEVKSSKALLWKRDRDFFKEYDGKRIVIGHTPTTSLKTRLAGVMPEEGPPIPLNDNVFLIDTGCGRPDGFLTALELPSLKVYESHH